MGSYRKYSKEDQKLMAIWSLDCAERALPFFEAINPKDERPRRAIETGRDWVRTGTFKMAVIRAASLEAHAAAKEARGNEAACFAVHAAGQAVAAAHVPQHAYGGAYYALKAIAVANSESAKEKVKQELRWQEQALPEHLRGEVMRRIIIDASKSKLRITIDKTEGF